MDLQSLHFFKAVADTGSFSAASRQLHFAQSHISTQISHLEQELGTSLFYRHSRGIRLSQSGMQFLEYTNRIIQLMDEAERSIQNDRPFGTLKIASMQTTAQSLLPNMLSAYHKAFPEVKLEITTGVASGNIQALRNHDADIAFVSGDYEDPSLRFNKLYDENLVLVSAADINVTTDLASLLSDHTLLVFPEGCSYRKHLTLLCSSYSAVPADLIVFDSLPGIIAGVCAGLGVTLLPQTIVQSYLDQHLLFAHEIPDTFSSVPLNMVTRVDEYQSIAIQEMAALIQSIK